MDGQLEEREGRREGGLEGEREGKRVREKEGGREEGREGGRKMNRFCMTILVSYRVLQSPRDKHLLREREWLAQGIDVLTRHTSIYRFSPIPFRPSPGGGGGGGGIPGAPACSRGERVKEEGGKEGGRKGGREGVREGRRREGRKEGGGREGGREERRRCSITWWWRGRRRSSWEA